MSPSNRTSRSARVTLLDGGTGRELKRSGAPFRQPEWSALALIEAPEFVSRVHRAFVDAGAEVITTNSYAVVPFHLGTERFASDGARLATLAGTLAREVADAAPHKVRVAGSLPPICGSYRPDWFDPQFAQPILETLIASLDLSVDLWLAETLSTIAEARLVRGLIGRENHPLWLSFTLADDGNAANVPSRLRSGESVSEAAEAAIELGAAAILFNCSQPEVMGSAVDQARRVLDARGVARGMEIGVYANAFVPQPADAQANDQITESRADLTPEEYGRWMLDWVARGAGIVGGCCGIGPEHIAKLRNLLPPRRDHS